MKQDLRHWIRKFVPRGLWTNLRHTADRLAIIRCEGMSALREMSVLDDREVTLRLKSLKHPFTLRRCESHIDGLVQNVFRGEYDRWLGNLEPRTIIDAGTFIGDLTCHWATRFPDARIVCLEPNPPSRKFAAANTSLYGDRVTLLPAGLGATAGRYGITGVEMGAHLVRSEDGGDESIEVTTIDDILKTKGITHIDLLKLDIEGFEGEVLAALDSWIDKVKVLVVEFHGSDLESDGVARLAAHGFRGRRYRSLMTFSRDF